MAECDVFVDQLFMGWYGMVSVEAMALGKPTLAFMRPAFEPAAAGCPVVRTSVETLEHDIADLLADAPRRTRLGEEGRAWVERHHDAHVIARQLVALYQELGVS